MQATQSSAEGNASARLAQLIIGYWVSQAIYVAAKLKIADHLAAGPATAESLATRVGVQPAALYRLLRALASVGVLPKPRKGLPSPLWPKVSARTSPIRYVRWP